MRERRAPRMVRPQVAPAQVAVIVPAYEEAATVGAVVAVARAHPAVGEVVVVDDGSRDATAARAAAAGARVVRLSHNRGKAQAMDRGVEETTAPWLLFIDADIVGLRAETLDLLIDAVTRERYEMYIAMVARKRFAGWLGWVLPVLGGTRILRRELWQALPARYKRRFRIEIALNHFAERARLRAGHRVVPGLGHVMKERKRGLWPGLRQRVLMIADIVSAVVMLSFVDGWTAGRRVLQAQMAAPQPGAAPGPARMQPARDIATGSGPLRFPDATQLASRLRQVPPSRRSRR